VRVIGFRTLPLASHIRCALLPFTSRRTAEPSPSTLPFHGRSTSRVLLGQYTVNVVQDDRKWERRVSVNPCKQRLSRAGEMGGPGRQPAASGCRPPRPVSGIASCRLFWPPLERTMFVSRPDAWGVDSHRLRYTLCANLAKSCLDRCTGPMKAIACGVPNKRDAACHALHWDQDRCTGGYEVFGLTAPLNRTLPLRWTGQKRPHTLATDSGHSTTEDRHDVQLSVVSMRCAARWRSVRSIRACVAPFWTPTWLGFLAPNRSLAAQSNAYEY